MARTFVSVLTLLHASVLFAAQEPAPAPASPAALENSPFLQVFGAPASQEPQAPGQVPADQRPAEEQKPQDPIPEVPAGPFDWELFKQLFPVSMELPAPPSPCNKTSGWAACEYVDFSTRVTKYTETVVNSGKLLVEKYAKPYSRYPGYSYLETALKKVESSVTAGLTVEERQLGGVIERDVSAKIRAAMMSEKGDRCNGAVIFLQGIGDSLQNHMKLYSALSEKGYRVITFDYMGQGASTGHLNDMRVESIPVLAEQVYQRYTGKDRPACAKKIVIGWSTGGTAAHYWTADQVFKYGNKPDNTKIDAVVLLNPSLSLRALPGETDVQKDLKALKLAVFTRKTMTGLDEEQARANGWIDDLVIRGTDGKPQPFSPTQTPDLAASIVFNSRLASLYATKDSLFPESVKKWIPARLWNAIPAQISAATFRKGLKVQLIVADEQLDSYVHPQNTWGTLQSLVPAENRVEGQKHFHYHGGAAHNLENGPKWLSDQVNAEVVDFLNKI
jgi:pimeloyl-ACP methyl ester carboxylesterase